MKLALEDLEGLEVVYPPFLAYWLFSFVDPLIWTYDYDFEGKRVINYALFRTSPPRTVRCIA